MHSPIYFQSNSPENKYDGWSNMYIQYDTLVSKYMWFCRKVSESHKVFHLENDDIFIEHFQIKLCNKISKEPCLQKKTYSL